MEPSYAPSPVPSDARLWPGELPFTAFGQRGPDTLDLRVFDQDTWWVDRLGLAHALGDMPVDYQLNVMLFLREHQESYHLATLRRALLQQIGDTLLGYEPLASLDPAHIREQDAHTWLESTTLMRRLRALTGT